MRAKLQGFYIELGDLIGTPLQRDLTDEEFSNYRERAAKILNAQGEWIQSQMGDAAFARYTDRTDMNAVHFSIAVNAVHNTMLMNQTRLRQNLKSMIESSAWANSP